jgi:hypothetical protein
LCQALKTLGATYASWFNKNYRRDGHLFQDRYKSEAVQDDACLFTALRYIHQNSIKAGICATLKECHGAAIDMTTAVLGA